MGLFDRLGGSDEPRVAFFGIDGVPHALIAENPETFPNLTEIAADGAGGPIDSIVPPESSACWPALTTGVNPGETGVYGFQDRENGSYDTYVPMGQDVRATRIWDRVANAGREATVLNVPVTFPPQRNVQRMASGFLSPSIEKAAYPDELREYLESSGYRIDVDAKLGHETDKSAFMEDAHETLDARYEAFSGLVERDDWDLFFGVFMTTDRVNHFLFDDYATEAEDRSLFLEFYAKVDRYLGALREQLPEDVTMVVASDHGFTSLHREVHLNSWLEESGWLSYQTDEHSSLNDIAPESRAYSLIPGRLFINLEGREPRGSVPQEEYKTVREQLRTELEALEGPDGQPVAERVVTKEEAFRGPHDDIAPDLVVIPTHGFDLKAGFKGHDQVFDVGPRNGMHSFDDACLFVDDASTRLANADLLDIAPTMLELLDIDVERTETDGTSLLQR